MAGATSDILVPVSSRCYSLPVRKEAVVKAVNGCRGTAHQGWPRL